MPLSDHLHHDRRGVAQRPEHHAGPGVLVHRRLARDADRETGLDEGEPLVDAAGLAHLARLGAPTLRLREGAAFRTDAGNLIYDLACGPLADPRGLDAALHAIPGVVETGLFVDRADVVLIAGATGVERRAR